MSKIWFIGSCQQNSGQREWELQVGSDYLISTDGLHTGDATVETTLCVEEDTQLRRSQQLVH